MWNSFRKFLFSTSWYWAMLLLNKCPSVIPSQRMLWSKDFVSKWSKWYKIFVWSNWLKNWPIQEAGAKTKTALPSSPNTETRNSQGNRLSFVYFLIGWHWIRSFTDHVTANAVYLAKCRWLGACVLWVSCPWYFPIFYILNSSWLLWVAKLCYWIYVILVWLH